MRLSNELQTGKAGEYMVCADLIMKGLVAFPSEQGLPYDVLLDDGVRLLRIQVKTTSSPRMVPQRNVVYSAYMFNVKRHGKNNSARYDQRDVDIFALVCLDTRKVGYIVHGDMPNSINFRVDALRGTYYDEKGIRDYETVMSMFGTMTQTAIAKKMDLAIATVNRMCQPGYKPFLTQARYFSDIERDREWFETVLR